MEELQILGKVTFKQIVTDGYKQKTAAEIQKQIKSQKHQITSRSFSIKQKGDEDLDCLNFVCLPSVLSALLLGARAVSPKEKTT